MEFTNLLKFSKLELSVKWCISEYLVARCRPETCYQQDLTCNYLIKQISFCYWDEKQTIVVF